MEQDWTANSKSTFATLGASNHTDKEREERDFYATPRIATEKLLLQEHFAPVIWECACGKGHITGVLEEKGYKVINSDIVNRMENKVLDFLCAETLPEKRCDIITNPPYRYAQEFVEKALSLLPYGGKCAFLLRLQFLEGIKRRKLFDKHPPKTVYVFSRRIQCCINGDFDKYKDTGSAIAYAWFVWVAGHSGETIVKWI